MDETQSVFIAGGLRVGGLWLAEEPVRHAPPLVDSAPESAFYLVLQLEGTSVYCQDGREAGLSAGDFTLCATARPFEVTRSVTDRCLAILIPDNLLRGHLACPDEVTGVAMSGTHGMTGVLSSFIKCFWDCRAAVADPTVALRMSYTLLDLVAAAYSAIPRARHEYSTLVTAHRVRIMAYIEANLRNPGMSPTTVARACKITVRYLHHLFTAEAETVTHYIQRRRLEECARALVAAPARGRLVTEIAFDYGFNSLTHFGRAFRHQFGLTPSEYRRAAHAEVS